MPEFREAEEADLAAIMALLADDDLGRGREAHVPDAYRRAFRAMARQEGNRMVVAVADGEVVGCMQVTVIHGLSRQGASRAQVEAVRVRRDRRRQGIGQAMLAHAVALARAAGCRLVQLTTDRRREDAHRFYERLGFVASHYGMKLDLPS
ncbi:MAG TPA: GNAT family N-acetyltransferase [Geminicoccus sp.]|uniref:GNAT family N-acetyltransferase n=1 Tax=Geminicoccus sp. TaxID=2024832 RepID=UPI002C9792E3|nr:GNAT family N-acetyltransferase [Geminicoccus sp.]HWL69065.1 GNAT family N-acetyltransferase [Geminicoccus sp.]